MHQTPLIRIMEEAAIAAGRKLVRDFNELEKLQVSSKGLGDFVTSADIKAEERILSHLQKARPDFGVLCEEKGIIEGRDTRHRWIVDPLDGTSNFMHGIPFFCISIALEATKPSGQKEIVAGLVYAPILQEMFWAEKGKGAFLNQQRLQVSSPKPGQPAFIAHGSRLEAKEATYCKRIFGAAALELAYVAAGKLDAFWDRPCRPWDMAAGIILVREARGLVSDWSGGSKMVEKQEIIAGAPHMEDMLRQVTRKQES